MKDNHKQDRVIERPQAEQKGLVTDVMVPIAQTAAGVWLGHRLSGQKPPPPPPKDD